MQIKITGRGIELTDAIRDYTEKKINGLSKFYYNIIRADVVVGVESHHHLKGDIFLAECRLYVPGKDVFASKNEKTLYKAIDKIRDYLEQELKKHKARQNVGEEKKNIRKKRGMKEYRVEI